MIRFNDSPAALLVCALLLAGCDQTPDPMAVPVTKPVEAAHRFRVELQGRFNAGHLGHQRDILTVTDTQTGKVYLGITGVGVCELYDQKHGKSHRLEDE